MVWATVMRKVKAGLLTILLSSIAVWFYFYKEMDIAVMSMVLLVFAAAIMTYGLAAASFAEYISSKLSSKKMALLARFLMHTLFGLILINGEFLVVYSLGASLIYFCVDEILRARENHVAQHDLIGE
ncbi:hypothetical protein DRW41_04620 [Neobacillus piezotolerans]|uniref:Uncharacterized protein n=1 Tax=Neobacillus piezotolerans TaxID=2259171 RepID=A0A3D8GXQ9_9BACI|nr:hypothetical protein [Neobacillus piezotolerans]RDU38846.1 hypothetical protein DRW41_04620 [Neobacillus piezotolerans]